MPRVVDGQKDQSLLEAMRAVFPDAEAPCGGEGRCGRCRVLVRDSQALLAKPGEEEMRLLGPDNLKAHWRLACLARFERGGALAVEAPERTFFFYPERMESTALSSGGGAGLCAAVDIGTTTINCALAEIPTGRTVACVAAANRQRSFGLDVVSRIESAVRAPENLKKMQRMVRGQVGDMLDGLCGRAGGGRPGRVHICGNTTMLHLWEGASLEGLARMPFQPAFLEGLESGLESKDGGYRCRLLPGISAFVGSDITAGILACGLQAAAGGPELLVDLGTNGEIVLAAEGKLYATAAAAGPAFEGAKISCGLPAVAGAIDSVTWEKGAFSFTTLGKEPPAGLCGSGLLDLLACLRRAGILDESGGLNVTVDRNGGRAFQLPLHPPLRLTQSDVRQLQLAKGAIAAGIRMLSRRADIGPDAIRRVHLAGSFGSSISSESAVAIGLIPRELAGRIKAAGNSALAGTIATARRPELLGECARIAAQVRVLDLSREPGFQDAFVNAMRFPGLSG
jgi:uncharacterized 2Fe-2S/4Fe-4S cluster protein (DUF4445 family)